MKNGKKVLASGLALTLLFSQGLSTVDAKGHKGKNEEKKTKLVDKNKNGIADKWEKKYKLKGKNIAQQDYDKDGLATLAEYKLNLNPKKADTNKNGISDGQEDADKDGLSNSSEIELGTNPSNQDTDKDKIKDGLEKGKDGVKLSEKVKELKFEIKLADKKSIKVEYKYKKGYSRIKIEDETNMISKEMINTLVSALRDTSNLTEDEILSKMQNLIKLENAFSVELEVEYFNGHEKGLEKDELKEDENKDDQQKIEDENENKDDQQKIEDENENKDDQQNVEDENDNNEDHQDKEDTK